MAQLTFAYEAQTHTGQPVNGTIDAPELPYAERLLAAMGLRILKLNPVETPKPRRSLAAADFIAFNQQLAQMTAAGMPVERGLKLIAADLRRGKLKRTIESIVTELETGKSLDAAFDAHRAQFPPLYGQIIEAGVRGGNLPAVLLALGRHLDTSRKLRTELVRTIAYPAMVLLAIGMLMIFLSYAVFPLIVEIYKEIMGGYPPMMYDRATRSLVPVDRDLPMVTGIVVTTCTFLGPLLLVAATMLLVLPMAWGLSPASGLARVIDGFMSRLPLIGSVLRKSLIARWLDALAVAIAAGLDLPNAVALASNAVASPALSRDSQRLIDALQAGRPIDTVADLDVLPTSLPALLQVAAAAGNLPEAVALLADSYRQQAETRITLIPAVLTPILMTLVALIIGGLIVALLSPLAHLIKWISGGFFL